MFWMMRLWVGLLVLVTVSEGWKPTIDWPHLTELKKALKNKLSPGAKVVLPGDMKYLNLTLMNNPDMTRLPGAIVLVKTKEDVRACILYAKKHNLPVTVRSSGHSYVGRSTADHSLMIDVSKMKGITVNTNDPDSDTGASAYVEAGNIWMDIYEEVDKYGLLAVGGYTGSVSIAGFTLGGGHGPLTRYLGFGVDQILEFTIVVANGDIVKATATEIEIKHIDGTKETKQNTDLFWAVRGGGSAFGVVTRFKIKLHQPPPSFVFFAGTVPLQAPGFPERGLDFLRFYTNFVKTGLTDKWSGLMLVSNAPFINQPTLFPDGSIQFAMLHFGGWQEAMASIKPVADAISPPGFPQAWQAMNFSTYYEYASTIPIRDEYMNRYIISRYIHEEDLGKDKLNKLLTNVLKRSSPGLICAAVHIGGEASRIPGSSCAISKNMRSARWGLHCLVGWSDDIDRAAQIQQLQELKDKMYSMGGGVYYNEPDYYLNNWKGEFWGTKYDRLKRVKRCWDPDNFFRCHMCVNTGGPCDETCQQNACGN